MILEEDELSDSAKENSICCDTCSTWWYLPCAGLTMSTADALVFLGLLELPGR